MAILSRFGEVLASETLGEVDKKKKKKISKEATKKPKESTKKPKETKKKKTTEEVAPKLIKKAIKEEPLVEPEEQGFTYANKAEGLLKLIGVELEPQIGNLITPNDVENVEFSVTAPTGLNAEEVEQFCDSVQRDISVYLNIIESRQIDFLKLLEHCGELEKKLVEQREESQLASYIVQGSSDEDKLRDKIANLQIENMELKEKLANFEKSDNTVNSNDITKEQAKLPMLDDDYFNELLEE
jgi:divIVA domain